VILIAAMSQLQRYQSRCFVCMSACMKQMSSASWIMQQRCVNRSGYSLVG